MTDYVYAMVSYESLFLAHLNLRFCMKGTMNDSLSNFHNDSALGMICWDSCERESIQPVPSVAFLFSMTKISLLHCPRFVSRHVATYSLSIVGAIRYVIEHNGSVH